MTLSHVAKSFVLLVHLDPLGVTGIVHLKSPLIFTHVPQKTPQKLFNDTVRLVFSRSFCTRGALTPYPIQYSTASTAIRTSCLRVHPSAFHLIDDGHI